MKSAISNCRFGEACRQQWETLDKTGAEETRYCTACRREVHRAADAEGLWSMLELGWCVALFIDDSQKPAWLGGPHWLTIRGRSSSGIDRSATAGIPAPEGGRPDSGAIITSAFGRSGYEHGRKRLAVHSRNC